MRGMTITGLDVRLPSRSGGPVPVSTRPSMVGSNEDVRPATWAELAGRPRVLHALVPSASLLRKGTNGGQPYVAHAKVLECPMQVAGHFLVRVGVQVHDRQS